MVESKTLILCADDFGLNPGVSEGILKLARMRRLSAVSCMVNAPDFIPHAQELAALKDQVQTGLHFNVTEGHLMSELGTSCFSLHELIIKTHLHALKPSFIAKEFTAQLDQYIDVMGSLPDFIDGHQHVHQFPGIRQVILTLYERRLRTHGTFIRSTWPAVNLAPYRFKARIVAATGGKALQSQLKKLAISHNPYFSGIYDFAQGSDYRGLFRNWLQLAPEHTLIMCHPGEDISSSDPIAHARLVELAYFLSDEFLADCEEYQVRL